MATQNPRVLTVEDDELTRVGLEMVLAEEGYVVQALPDGTKADRVAAVFHPDLVILDVELGAGPDGFTVARRLRQLGDFPILFLTGKTDVEDRLAGFKAGADDYLVKPFAVAELLARVRVILRRAGRETSAVTQIGDLVVDHHAEVVTRGGHAVKLTPTEYHMLSVLVRSPGRVVPKAQLLSDTWDEHLVDVHVSSLRRKLEEHGPRIIHTVRGKGFMIGE